MMIRESVSSLRGNPLYWRYVSNLRATMAQRLKSSKLDKVQVRILHDLRRNGVAITHIDELIDAAGVFAELEAAITDLEQKQAGELEEARRNVDKPGFKSYQIQMLGSRPVLDDGSIFLRFALDRTFLDIVNAYFGMYTCLAFLNVWHTFPTQAEARNSQLWHRDPEDMCILKMFVYFTDVTEANGAMVYAPGTHHYGSVRQEPATFGEEGTTARRADDQGMGAVVPEKDWVTAVGRKGTILFADTRGYHKGGLAREGERLVYNCRYVSRATPRGRSFDLTSPHPDEFRDAREYALLPLKGRQASKMDAMQ